MTKVREWQVSLLDWETRYVLAAIDGEMSRLRAIAESSEDADEAAEAGNDYLEIASLKERLEAEAKAVFGEQVVIFDNRKR